MEAIGLSFIAPRRVEWVSVNLPPLFDGDVLVRTLYSGISPGSELLAYRGQIDPDLPLDETIDALHETFTYPFFYGYSCVGLVEEGRNVDKGSPVFVFSPHQSAVVAPADDVVRLGEIQPRLGTLFPLVETALQISLEAGDVGDKTVALFGLGPVGVLAGSLLARSGARVIGADPVDFRREVAASFGVEGYTPSRLGDIVDEATAGKGVPLAIEASGNPDALRSALDLLAHEGTALVASWYGRKVVELPLGGRFHRRRLTIRSTQVSTIPAALAGEWTIARRRNETVKLMSELPLDVLATHTWPHLAAAEAFAALDEGREGLLHAALAYE